MLSKRALALPSSRLQSCYATRYLRRGYQRAFSSTYATPTNNCNNNNNNSNNKSDRLLVVGSGVAGSATALIAAETYQIPVTVVYAGRHPTDCNSYWAQGGIIYRNYVNESRKYPRDSADLLAQDIHRAGAGLCHDPAVRKVSEEGPDRVRQLLLAATSDGGSRFANVPFDRDEVTDELLLCLEASHAAPRILHKADHTGRVITEHITEAAARHPLITMQSNTIVTDVITTTKNSNETDDNDALCIGVQTLQQGPEYAKYGVVLAAGGLAGIYEHTTNPAGFNALGSSVGVATRSNVTTQDLEFVQFHPTALCLPDQARFLLTEALRGEGAILRNAQHYAFARDYHPDGELAPRDVVARAVFSESQKGPVYLDITHRDADWLHRRFPSICQHLKENSNLDIAHDPLPIIPAAHYTCGGVATDLDGCTSLHNLYAAGEAARTGLHGGNRLASTSLLEGLVFGASVADHVGNSQHRQHVVTETARAIASFEKEGKPSSPSARSSTTTTTPATEEKAMGLLQTLRRVMWDHVGVTRTQSGLEHAQGQLRHLVEEAQILHETSPSVETSAVRDATCAGYAVAKAAARNPRSVGAHCIVDDDATTTTTSPTSSDEDSDDDDVMAVAAMGR